MHTNEEQDPWWRVDLGKEYIVTGKSGLFFGERDYCFAKIGKYSGALGILSTSTGGSCMHTDEGARLEKNAL